MILGRYGKFSPIITKGLPDWDKDSSKWEDWFMEQKHYYQNGYEVGGERITGAYYWLLNFATVEALDERRTLQQSSPYHIDVLKEMFDTIEHVSQNNLNLFVWKARDKMFSYSMSAFAASQMTMEKNATIITLFPKGEEVRYKENFRAKYDVHMNNLPDCMKVYPDIEANQGFLHYGYIETDENGRKHNKGHNNKIAFTKITNKDVGKSFRTKWIIIDEAGEVDILKSLVDTSEANMMYGGDKFGSVIMGGTSNQIHKGYKDVCHIWDNAKSLGFEKFFIPRYKALFGWIPQFDEKGKQLDEKKEAIDLSTGESLISVAENYFENKIRLLEEAKDAQGLIEFKQNYPKTEADAFLQSGTSPFPIEELRAQKALITTNTNISSAITRGNLQYVVGSNPLQVEFVASPHGKWQKAFDPDPTLPIGDVIGVDTVLSDADVVDTDSKNSIVVYRPFQSMDKLTGLPVCIYHYRPSSLYTFFQDAMLTSIYYNAPTLIEYINQMAFDYYVEHGNGRYLAFRPTLLTEMGSKAQNRWGVKPQSGKGIALNYAIEETRNNVHNQPFVELIDELIAFDSKNTDIAMAYLWAILLAKEKITTTRRAAAAVVKKKPTKTHIFVKNNGILQAKQV